MSQWDVESEAFFFPPLRDLFPLQPFETIRRDCAGELRRRVCTQAWEALALARILASFCSCELETENLEIGFLFFFILKIFQIEI